MKNDYTCPGGRVPRDGSITKIKQARLDRSMYGIICFLATVGIVLALLFLGFNTKYQKERYIFI